MTYTVAPEVVAALPWVGAALILSAAILWLGKPWVRQLFESEHVPSIRLVAGFAVVVVVLWHADTWREAVIEALLVFAGTLFGFGTVKVIASRFSDKPTIDPTQQKDPDAPPETTPAP